LASGCGEHIGYESHPGLVDPVHRGLFPDRNGRSNVYTGAARGYVDDKRFDQMAGELKA
jgi:hypothetical protein